MKTFCYLFLRALAGPFPFQSATRSTGLVFGISDTREFDGKSIKQPTQFDWSVSVAGLPDALNNRKATSWDTQTLCLQYFNGAGATMDSCLVPGSPYITLTFVDAAVSISSLQGDITSFEWVVPGTNPSNLSIFGAFNS
jgi:endo-1,3(4)-beta-glucanase